MLIGPLSKFEGNRSNSLRCLLEAKKKSFEKTALRKISCFANWFCPQTPSTGFSDSCMGQSTLGKFTTINFLVKFLRKSPKTLVFCNALKAKRYFFRSAVFFEGLAKCRRRKRRRMLKWLSEENQQKKAGQRNCAWIIFKRISVSLTICRYRT